MKQMIVTSAVNDVTDNVEETILCLSTGEQHPCTGCLKKHSEDLTLNFKSSEHFLETPSIKP